MNILITIHRKLSNFQLINIIKSKIIDNNPRLFYLLYRFILFHRDDVNFLYSKEISEFIVKNKVDIKKYVENLDKKSREVFKTFLKRIFYISFYNRVLKNKVFSLKDVKLRAKIQKLMPLFEKKFSFPIEKKLSVSVFYFRCGLIYLPKNVVNNLKNKDFIDGGAFIGDTSLMLEKYYNPKKVYAFEPELRNFIIMGETIKRNNLKNIIPINKGIGDKEELLRIDSSFSDSRISEKGLQEIEIITIDNYVFRNNLDVGLIQLDIEGYGLKALKGAEKTLKKYKPVLLIDIYHNGEEFFLIKNYLEILNLNYNFKIRKLDPNTPLFETVLIAW